MIDKLAGYGIRIFSQNHESNPLTFHFQSSFFWKPGAILILESSYEIIFFSLETLECSLLVYFPVPSITVLYLDSWLSFIVLGGLWVLLFWKSASFYSRKYSQVISLGFCLVLVFWFCFWISYCLDRKPELVVWFFFSFLFSIFVSLFFESFPASSAFLPAFLFGFLFQVFLFVSESSFCSPVLSVVFSLPSLRILIIKLFFFKVFSWAVSVSRVCILGGLLWPLSLLLEALLSCLVALAGC